ncbi:MAG: ribosome biogenesis GTPase YlqF [Clostridia bacterium]|nr:ribosome biogenesis GTPase YlqF [Clostridia bacterium]
MAKNPIQWFPGHMAKTRRMMTECLPQVDLVLELIDARIPKSSRNPEIDKMLAGKPRVIVMTKATLASPDMNRAWVEHYRKVGLETVLIDVISGMGIQDLSRAVEKVCAEKLQRWQNKGMEGRKLKAMIVGIPNVGKSSLINKLAGGKKAKVENRPGVTVNKQWIPTEIGLDLLDMPGVLWPKFEDEVIGQNLAFTGAIRDQILDTEEIAMLLCGRLMECAPKEFMARYKLTEDETEGLDCYDLFELVGRRRGFLISGGEINHERTANMLLEEFRAAKIGRITLEKP